MKNLLLVFLIIYVSACSGIEFVYKDNKNLTNPIYEKTEVNTTGLDLVFINSYIPMFFGVDKEGLYELSININETKTNRSVEANQVTTNIKHDLIFYYTLLSKEKKCVIYEKEILSYFSVIPKSSGYNYGTDASLEKKYELAISENLNRFVTFVSSANLSNCK